jgi:hypothetical protein
MESLTKNILIQIFKNNDDVTFWVDVNVIEIIGRGSSINSEIGGNGIKLRDVEEVQIKFRKITENMEISYELYVKIKEKFNKDFNKRINFTVTKSRFKYYLNRTLKIYDEGDCELHIIPGNLYKFKNRKELENFVH